MKKRLATFRRVALFQDGEGLGLEPVDPREDLAFTARAIVWIIGVVLWLAGLVRSRRQVEDEVISDLLDRASRDGLIRRG